MSEQADTTVVPQALTFASKRGFPVGVVVWGGIAALAFAAAGVWANPHFALAAFPACAMAIGIACTQTPAFRGRLTDDALCVGEPEEAIPYRQIHSITLGGMPCDPRDARLKSRAIMVMDQDGVVEIPARLNVATVSLYRHLLAEVSTSGSRDVNPQLAPVVAAEENKFGADRVWTFAARPHLGRRPSTRRGWLCFGLLMLVGLAWIVLPSFVLPQVRGEPSPWVPLGILFLMFSLPVWLVLIVRPRHPDARLRGWHAASLVVSPTGIAMIQGDVRGELKWEELRDVTLGDGPGGGKLRFEPVDRKPGIHLVVEGAAIRIADIYDRPLPVIHAAIRRYWRGSE